MTDKGDPLDDPAGKATERVKGTKHQASNFIGCPMAWLKQVLPHVRGEHQVVVALLIYRRWVLCGRRRTFDLPNGDLRKLNINRHAKSRALARLERAGLVAVTHLPGCAARVTRRWR
jgi:hypothetical protein